MTALLEVTDLSITFPGNHGASVTAVDRVSFGVAAGEVVALVGESGCGKTLTGLSLPGLLPPAARLGDATAIRFNGVDIARLPERELRQYRGRRIAVVFQDPLTSLNPVMRVGRQIAEAVQAHRKVSNADARQRAIELLAEVGIADPSSRVDSYPHQLSGGMRQRVMIAIALAGEPDLLVADEPTTALDVTVQAQILELLDRLRASRGMAVLLITHDLGIVAGRADRVIVMYAGRVAETSPTADLFARPSHPYTRGLFASIPRLTGDGGRLPSIPGTVPRPDQWPGGCRFNPRCPLVVSKCRELQPGLDLVALEHRAACWVTTGQAG